MVIIEIQYADLFYYECSFTFSSILLSLFNLLDLSLFLIFLLILFLLFLSIVVIILVYIIIIKKLINLDYLTCYYFCAYFIFIMIQFVNNFGYTYFSIFQLVVICLPYSCRLFFVLLFLLLLVIFFACLIQFIFNACFLSFLVWLLFVVCLAYLI